MTIASHASLLEAFRRINDLSGGVMTLLVTDEDGRLLGTLTDGDLRRAILAGQGLESPVQAAMHTPCASLPADRPDEAAASLRRMRREGLRLVPVVDPEGRVVEVVDTCATPARLPVQAVLMAGGRGERLRPLTLDVPKPLLPVGGRPVIDRNIEMLARAGVTDITVTVNYLAEQLEAHFAEPVAGVQVKTLREPCRLGTIGSAALARLRPGGTTLVMNSDLLTRIDLEDFYLHHVQAGADASMAVLPYNVSVPYAVVTTGDDGLVRSLDEKPTYSHYANAGIYLISNSLLEGLPTDAPTDAPDLLADAISRGARVAAYPFDEMWIDIGTPADYAHACAILKA